MTVPTITTTHMNYAQLHYILPKQRTARKSSAEGHRDKLTADLAQWQEQIARDNGAAIEDVTVIVSEAGSYVAHIGPWTWYRKGATERAGISTPRRHTYYEQVRDHVERLAGCDTSDAQGIIEAWELKNGGTIMEDKNVNAAEEAGTDPEQLARTILNMPEEPQEQPVDTRKASIAKGHHAGSLMIDGSTRVTQEDREEFAHRWNCHPELLKAATAYRNHLRTAAHTEEQVRTYEHLCDIIAKATGK